MLLLPLLFAALPAAQCSNIDGDVVFHDQSPVYCSPLEPMPGDTVCLRLRAAHSDLTSVTVRIWDTGLNSGAGGEVLVPMWVEGQVGPGNQFDMWRADVQVGTDHLWYRFPAGGQRLRGLLPDHWHSGLERPPAFLISRSIQASKDHLGRAVLSVIRSSLIGSATATRTTIHRLVIGNTPPLVSTSPATRIGMRHRPAAPISSVATYSASGKAVIT